MLGSWPIAMKKPRASRSRTAPVFTFRIFSPRMTVSPTISSTTESVTTSILGLAKVRSTMMRLARNSARRWMSTTRAANRVR